MSERIFLNIDILIHDLSKTEGSSWRRWPFIKRRSKRGLLDEHTHELELDNPKIKLDVGTHYIEIMIPTVKEDFLDLPIINNFVKLFRYRRAAQTVYNRKMKSEEKNEYGMNSYEENMAYECLYDT